MSTQDSSEYRQKKQFFGRMLTVYGRNPVQEALNDPQLRVYRLHLADSNKASSQLQALCQMAKTRGVEVLYHSKAELSRISKNSQQDQGVALDVITEGFMPESSFLEQLPQRFELMALDGVTNPQNLGMIVRSVCASPMTGLLLPEKGCAKLDALVIKASAGTLFRCRIIRCSQLAQTLKALQAEGTHIYGLDAKGTLPLAGLRAADRSVMVMGNESLGLSADVQALCDHQIAIPMQNGVESLNVSVAASLIAFRHIFTNP
jgi:23S rRNA (guanosine2251-2'-O)-methyltransferase